MGGLRTIVLNIDHPHSGAYADVWRSAHDVVAFSTSDPGARERFGGLLPSARAFSTWTDLLGEYPDAELAYVFGRHSEMAAVAVAVARAGIPFVLEKPGGLCAREVGAVLEAARRSGTPAAVAFVQRVGPLPGLLHAVGPLRHCSFQFIGGYPQRYVRQGSGWLLQRSAAGGGVLLNLGVHFIDLFRAAAGGAVTVLKGEVGGSDRSPEVEDHAAVLLASSTGARAIVEVGLTFPGTAERYVNYTAAGGNGFLSVDNAGRVVARGLDGDVRRSRVDVDSNHYYADFARAVIGSYHRGFAGLPTLADLRAAVTVVDAVYREGV